MEYNDLDKEYKKIMSEKGEKIKETEESKLYVRGSEILQKKIELNKKWIRFVKDVTMGVHVFLYLVIIVLIVYRLQ